MGSMQNKGTERLTSLAAGTLAYFQALWIWRKCLFFSDRLKITWRNGVKTLEWTVKRGFFVAMTRCPTVFVGGGEEIKTFEDPLSSMMLN